MTRTAIVAGAGIGGLAAAIALRRAGWRVRILERASSPRELGFGLLLAPNAVKALGELGIADVVLARAHAPTAGELRRMDGTVVKRAEFPPPEALGGPMVVALRPALHGALLDAVGEDVIELDSEVMSFAIDAGGGVRVVTHRGDTVAGDVLIGADGAGSVVRRALHPGEAPPRRSGIVAVRGAVHGAVHHLHGLSAVYYMDRGVEAFMVRASDTGIYWALSLSDTLLPPGMREPREIVGHMASRFEQPFRAVTWMTEDLRCDELIDRDPLTRWGEGPVTLLGDAAHPVLPHTGQGAAQAMVDAVTLARVLAAHSGAPDSVPGALRTYEQQRLPKVAALVGQGRRTARIMRTTNPVVCALRELAIRLMPVKPLVKLLTTINRRAGTDLTRV